MKNYYFTFGQNHWNREGFPMKNHWVKVTADSYEAARSLFMQEFTSNYMERPDKFAFQYTEEEFTPHYYPGGEFLALEQQKDEQSTAV